MNLDKIMNELTVQNTSREILEQIDQDITYIVNIARKAVEGPTQKVPYYRTKVESQNKLLYWKSKLQ